MLLHLAGSRSVNTNLHVSIELLLWLYSFIFLLSFDDRFNVDLWRMAIARHREKLGMRWQIGSIVRKRKKGKNENMQSNLEERN